MERPREVTHLSQREVTATLGGCGGSCGGGCEGCAGSKARCSCLLVLQATSELDELGCPATCRPPLSSERTFVVSRARFRARVPCMGTREACAWEVRATVETTDEWPCGLTWNGTWSLFVHAEPTFSFTHFTVAGALRNAT